METLEREVGKLENAAEVTKEAIAELETQVKEVEGQIEQESEERGWMQGQLNRLFTRLDEIEAKFTELTVKKETPSPEEKPVEIPVPFSEPIKTVPPKTRKVWSWLW